MNSNFYLKKKNVKLNTLFNKTKIENNFTVKDIKTLLLANKNDLTFFDSVKYKDFAAETKAGACVTTEKLKKFLPEKVEKIIVKNVLFEIANIIKKIYPFVDIDYPDYSVKKPQKKKI